MQCLKPRTVGFKADGKTLSFSSKHYSKEFAPFQIPCGKCRACRLENARQTAIRCVHEASLYQKNSFVTLTYRPEALTSKKLQYSHFQKFMKDLRNSQHQAMLDALFPKADKEEKRRLWRELPKERKEELFEPWRVSCLVTGEYGDKNKRPHWHVLLFNWRPNDLVPHYQNQRGDQVYRSKTLEVLWPHGMSDLGDLTFESASYCARYATKKLYHGKDGTHEYDPISRRSTKYAIGKRWIEKYWRDCFGTGFLVFKKGDRYIQTPIPRYYERWFKNTHPEKWRRYVTEVKLKVITEQRTRSEKISLEEREADFLRRARDGLAYKRQMTQNDHRAIVLEQNAHQLQKYLKL